MTNLTRTSGQAATPFGAGELKSEDGVWFEPAGPSVLAVQRETDTDPSRLLSINLSDGSVTTVLQSVDEIPFAGSSGDRGYLVIERELPGKPVTLVELAFGQPGGSLRLTELPNQSTMVRTVVGPTGHFAGVVRAAGLELLGRYDGLESDLLTPFSLTYGPTLGFTANQTLTATIVEPISGDSLFLTWSRQGKIRRLYPTLTEGIVLPGS